MSDPTTTTAYQEWLDAKQPATAPPAVPVPEQIPPAAAGAPLPPPAPAAEVPSGAADPSSAAPAAPLAVGQIVKHTYDSPYDGLVTKFGLVVEYDTAGEVPRAAVAWLGLASGLLPASELTAV